MKRRNDVCCCNALFLKKILKQYFRKQFVLLTGFIYRAINECFPSEKSIYSYFTLQSETEEVAFLR